VPAHTHSDPGEADDGEHIELSVVIVNHNGHRFLASAVAALQRHTMSDHAEIIVVDSASTDGSAQALADGRLPVRVVRCTDNVGFCRGNNIGAEHARGRLIAFTQSDGEVLSGWDPPLCHALGDASIAQAGGLVLSQRDGELIEAAGIAIAPNMAAWSLCEGLSPEGAGLLDEQPREVVGLSPAFMMVRRAQHLELGGFWEQLWMYGDEPDYALRMARYGKAVLCPGSRMRHWGGGSSGAHQSPLRLYQSSRNRLLNSARHLPAGRALVAIAVSAGFDTLQVSQRRTLEASRAVLRGWRDGLLGMSGARRLSTRAERAANVPRLATLGDALRQQRELGRLRVGSPSDPGWGRVPAGSRSPS
jgi:N-acetylglucosaminyl-diphospho-decaprenol L-rhamnosyltransferase